MISFVGVTHSNNPSLVGGRPSVAAGDFMLAVVNVNVGNLGTPTPPAGWTVLYEPSFAPSSDAMWVQIAYKIAGGSEPSTYTWTWGGSNASVTIAVWRGDAALSIDVSEKADTLSADLALWDYDPGSNPLYAVPSLIPNFDQDCLIAIAVSLHQFAGNYLPVIDGYQVITGYTSRFMQPAEPNATSPAIIIQDLIGASCDETGVLSGIRADDWEDVSFHIALTEAGASACGAGGFRDYCQSVNQDVA